jgi:hypothetical protein
MEYFSNFDISINSHDVQKAIKLQNNINIDALINTALTLTTPKAIYSIEYPEFYNNSSVTIAGKEYQSTVLRKNIEHSNSNRVILFILTIGKNLEMEAEKCTDYFNNYLLNKIGDFILRQARQQLQDHLQNKYGFKTLSRMSPGSLPDWPLEEQSKLISSLGNVDGNLGVHLNESLLMVPRKSVSGIFFSSEIIFFSCQLCPRNNCDDRKAPYDTIKVQEYYNAK